MAHYEFKVGVERIGWTTFKYILVTCNYDAHIGAFVLC